MTYSKIVSMRGICNRSLSMYSFNLQATVGRRVDNAIHWIDFYQVYSAASFVGIYPLDSDLSVG